jgi:hypothetical protein
MTTVTSIAIIYSVFSVFVVYVAARPSNRKRVLNLTLCVINSVTARVDEFVYDEQLLKDARRVLPWGMATFALLLAFYLIAAR